jgi:hypothetical protein
MPNPPPRPGGSSSFFPLMSKKHEIVLFSSTAIALYGYDQGEANPKHSSHPSSDFT